MNSQSMPQQNTTEGMEKVARARMVVALDASPFSVSALHAAAQLAALFEADLEGVFVEDINLIHLCGFPFGQEIGSYTAVSRRLDDRTLERQLKAVAGAIEDVMQRVAGPAQVRWSFRVQRGGVVPTLLDAAQRATVLSLGRASYRQRRTLGSTVQSMIRQSRRPLFILGERGMLASPLVLLYSGSEAAERALRLAIDLAARTDIPLRVVVLPGTAGEEQGAALQGAALQEHIEEMALSRDVDAQVETYAGDMREPAGLVRELAISEEADDGTLIIPGDFAAILAERIGPAILVP